MITRHDDEVLCVEDVVLLVKAAPRTVQIWAEAGKIKAFKIGRQWRFMKSDVLKFLDEQRERDPE